LKIKAVATSKKELDLAEERLLKALKKKNRPVSTEKYAKEYLNLLHDYILEMHHSTLKAALADIKEDLLGHADK